MRAIGWIETPAAGQLKLALADADPNLSGRPEPTPAAAAPAPASPADPNLSGVAETSICLDRDPTDRRLDRFLAFLGILDDAVPLFGPAKSVPRAGVLMAIPALLDIGVFEIAREVYGSIGPAFYGLRTTMATLLLSALLRIKRPEAFKEHSPTDLGGLLGLDRAPEVKTVRRKLRALADLGRAADFGRQLARRRASRLGAALGFLYVDGHVRAYHGATALPKTHITRMRIALPATTDYWVNDASGDPLFVLTAPANAGMVQMLPRLLAEIRQTVGKRRLTVVFDRGGFSYKHIPTTEPGRMPDALYGARWSAIPYAPGRAMQRARIMTAPRQQPIGVLTQDQLAGRRSAQGRPRPAHLSQGEIPAAAA